MDAEFIHEVKLIRWKLTILIKAYAYDKELWLGPFCRYLFLKALSCIQSVVFSSMHGSPNKADLEKISGLQ